MSVDLQTATAVPPELLEGARALTAQAKALVLGMRTGIHRSRLRGGGSEFSEYTPYSPGDDLRHVDWKVLGRTDKYVVRRYLADRVTRVRLLVDRSGSMAFGTTGGRPPADWGPRPATKWEAARLLTLALAFTFLRQGDPVGLAMVQPNAPPDVPPRAGESRLGMLAARLVDMPAQGRGDLRSAVSSTAARGRRDLVVVVSDLLVDEGDEWMDALGVHAARGREAWVVHVVDPAEIDFPYEEPTLFRDLEGAGDLSLNPREAGRSYREEFAAFLEDRREACLDRGVRYLRVNTADPLSEALGRFLEA